MNLKLTRVGDKGNITYNNVNYLVKLVHRSTYVSIYEISEPSGLWEVLLIDKLDPMSMDERLHCGIISCINRAHRVYQKLPCKVLVGRLYKMSADFDLRTRKISDIRFTISLQSVVPSMTVKLIIDYNYGKFMLSESSLEVLDPRSILVVDPSIGFRLPEYPLPEIIACTSDGWVGYVKKFYYEKSSPSYLTAEVLLSEESLWAVVAMAAKEYIDGIKIWT